MNDMVARRLGLEPEEERRLRAAAIARIGRRPYLVRRLAFLVATSPGVSRLVPRDRRQAAIAPLVFALLPAQIDLLAYVEGA